ncbi:MAG: hypothetical protein M3P39_06755, partial [Actinomycetota bacterium]|nr:hypothetical protein [Actinomycetota bacterium]
PPAGPTTPTVPTPRPKRPAPAQTVPDPAPAPTTGDDAPPPAPVPPASTPPSTPPPAADPPAEGEGEGDDGGIPADALVELGPDALATFDPRERPGAEFGDPAAAADGDPDTVWDVVVPADGEDVEAGLVIDLGERRRVASLTVRTTTPGFDARVYVARRGVPDELSGWERVAAVRDVPREREIAVDVDARVRRILLWITDAGDEEDPRVAIGEVQVEAG